MAPVMRVPRLAVLHLPVAQASTRTMALALVLALALAAAVAVGASFPWRRLKPLLRWGRIHLHTHTHMVWRGMGMGMGMGMGIEIMRQYKCPWVQRPVQRQCVSGVPVPVLPVAGLERAKCASR